MNRLMMHYPLMEEAGAAGGGAAPTNTSTAGGEAPAGGGESAAGGGEGGGGEGGGEGGGAKPGETLLSGEENNGGEGGAAPAKKPTSLLDDEQENGGEKPQGEEKPQEQAAPSAEDVQKWTDGVKAIDLGDGVKWDDAALTAITPELMKLSGNDPKKAEGLLKAYTAHRQAELKAFQEQQDAFNTGLIKQCQERFGADLKKVAGFAKKGGAAIFGEKIWNEMKVVPAFANNPDIMERLADVGRRIATDGGKVTSQDGGTASGSADVLHRMYGDVKV